MSVLEPGATEAFIFRIWKSLTANPSVRWANTYEARFTELGSSDDLTSLLAGLEAFEKALTLDNTDFLYGTISTWLPDAHPYNPDSFVTVPMTGHGDVGVGTGTPVDLRVCLSLRRNVSSGFQGKIELRSSLLASQLIAPAGTYALAVPGDFDSNVAEAISGGGIDANLTGGAAQPRLAMIGAEEVTRFMTGISVGGISVIKLNHKFFNRS